MDNIESYSCELRIPEEKRIKMCPFCGGEPDFEHKDNYNANRFWRVVCTNCGCGTWCDEDGSGYMDNPGKQKAIEAWNRRCCD